MNPMHGGQIRVSEIASHLKRLGHVVQSISICESNHANYERGSDFIFDTRILNNPFELPFCNDVLTAMYSGSGAILNFIRKKIVQFEPNVIFLEQGWLWPALQQLLKEGVLNRNNVKIIYSSHNIESKTKEQILKKHSFNESRIKEVVEYIENLENSLIRSADATICVTESDLNYFQRNVTGRFFLAPNGVARQKLNPNATKAVKNIVGEKQYLLFVGSAYPPNASGFWDMLGPSLSFLTPNQGIVVVGGVGEILFPYAPTTSEISLLVNELLVIRTGKVTSEILQALIEGAKGIILPIMTGGGSNLKTAEAIAARKPVVSTSLGCRGYDFVNRLSDFTVTDNAVDFKLSCKKVLQSNGSMEIDLAENTLRESVYWESALKEVGKIFLS
jgi:glycosyltransferase involved in cell wall biosynthesis